MTYEKFPFGKYKGQLLSDLPNTYIVHALETFELPDELTYALQDTLLFNLGIVSKREYFIKVVESVWSRLDKEYAPQKGAASTAINEFKLLTLDSLG